MANQIIWWIVRTFGSFYIRHLTTPANKNKRRFAPLAVHRRGKRTSLAPYAGDPIALWVNRMATLFRKK